MPRQAATVGSLLQAFEVVKEMQADGPDRRLPAQRPRRSALMLPLQDPCRAKAGQDHQRRRTEVPRGPQTDTARGNLPGPDIDGPHHPRGLHPRRQVAGNRYPVLADT